VTQAPSIADREYALWLGRVHVRAMLPLKWALLAICIVFWMWPRGWLPPAPPVFALFLVHGLVAAAETYFFLWDRVTPSQVRRFALGSWVCDLLLITALAFFDNFSMRSPLFGTGAVEVFPLFILMILRGFALFRTRTEQTVAASVVTAAFLALMVLQAITAEALNLPRLLLQLSLIWVVLFLSTTIVEVINRQHEEVLRQRERLLRGEALASIGELAAGVAHEINNPIGVIITYCEYLRKVPGPPPTEDLDQILHEARRCSAIVRQMLEFANPRVAPMQPVDMAQLLREVCDFLRLDKAAQVELTVEAPTALPPVLGDPGQLRQVILNCAINARQAIQAGAIADGRVVFTLSRLSGPRAPVELRIRDNGPGIQPADVERAFDPFFTRRAEGTGLGLAITRRIVEAHGGTIAIAPALPRGTEVRITLPRAGEEDAWPAPHASTEAAPRPAP
jgi:signal transduction histidine kinase